MTKRMLVWIVVTLISAILAYFAFKYHMYYALVATAIIGYAGLTMIWITGIEIYNASKYKKNYKYMYSIFSSSWYRLRSALQEMYISNNQVMVKLDNDVYECGNSVDANKLVVDAMENGKYRTYTMRHTGEYANKLELYSAIDRYAEAAASLLSTIDSMGMPNGLVNDIKSMMENTIDKCEIAYQNLHTIAGNPSTDKQGGHKEINDALISMYISSPNGERNEGKVDRPIFEVVNGMLAEHLSKKYQA